MKETIKSSDFFVIILPGHDVVSGHAEVSEELSDLVSVFPGQSVDLVEVATGSRVVRMGARLKLTTSVDHGQCSLAKLLKRC